MGTPAPPWSLDLSLSAMLGQAWGDTTINAGVYTMKVDPTPTPASNTPDDVTSAWGNLTDDFVRVAFTALSRKARVWQLASLPTLGTDDGLAVGDLGRSLSAPDVIMRCASAAASSSTWVTMLDALAVTSDTATALAMATTAQSDATLALASAATAQSTASTALVNAATAQSTADTASTNATAAQSTANTAITNAATAQSTANTAITNAATAQSTANTAITNAATAQSTANTAVTNAALAQSDADALEVAVTTWRRSNTLLNSVIKFRTDRSVLIGPTVNSLATGSIASTTNALRVWPFVAPQTFTVSAITFRVTTGVALAQIRAVCYSANADGYPSSLQFSGSTASAATTNTNAVSTLGANYQFVAGQLYWIGCHTDLTATYRGAAVGALAGLGMATDATATAQFNSLLQTITFASGAPATWTFAVAQLTTAAVMPIAFSQPVSVP